MKKIKIAYVLLFIAAVILSACGKQTTEPVKGTLVNEAQAEKESEKQPAQQTETAKPLVEAQFRPRSLKETVIETPVILEGIYREKTEKGYVMDVIKVYRGVETKSVLLRCDAGWSPEKDVTYLLFLEPFADVMTDTDFYVPGCVIWEQGDELKLFAIPALEQADYSEVIEKLPELVSGNPYNNGLSTVGDYIHSYDPAVIYEEADCVVLARVSALTRTFPSRQWCTVEVDKTLKGETPDANAQIVVPLDFVKEGETYVFCLSSISGGTDSYIIAAPNSIYEETGETARELLAR